MSDAKTKFLESLDLMNPIPEPDSFPEPFRTWATDHMTPEYPEGPWYDDGEGCIRSTVGTKPGAILMDLSECMPDDDDPDFGAIEHDARHAVTKVTAILNHMHRANNSLDFKKLLGLGPNPHRCPGDDKDYRCEGLPCHICHALTALWTADPSESMRIKLREAVGEDLHAVYDRVRTAWVIEREEDQ